MANSKAKGHVLNTVETVVGLIIHSTISRVSFIVASTESGITSTQKSTSAVRHAIACMKPHIGLSLAPRTLPQSAKQDNALGALKEFCFTYL